MSRAAQTANGKRRILLAEDDPSILKVTKLRLEHEGFDVIVATDGQAAVDAAMAIRTIDLILLDVRMPKLDGFQVCKRLKQNPLTTRIPIIIFTASVTQMQRLADRCMELGVSAWLRKPFRSKDLLAKVRQALGEEGTRDV